MTVSLTRSGKAGAQACPVTLKNLTESVDTIVDTGAAQATPHLRLVAGDHRLAGDGLDFLDHLERTNAAAAQENRVGIGLIDVECEPFPERRGDRAELDAGLEVEPLDIEQVETLVVQEFRFTGIDFVEARPGPCR